MAYISKDDKFFVGDVEFAKADEAIEFAKPDGVVKQSKLQKDGTYSKKKVFWKWSEYNKRKK